MTASEGKGHASPADAPKRAIFIVATTCAIVWSDQKIARSLVHRARFAEMVASPSSARSAHTVKIFIVVAQDRPDLYDYFRDAFDGVAMVEVILDRRLREPGHREPMVSVADNRRVGIDIYDELQLRGFVIVRVPA